MPPNGTDPLPNIVVYVDPSLPPAIIDFSPVWAPNGFSEGIVLADIIAWEHASDDELKAFKNRPDIGQLGWYGVLRRIAEQPEHMKWLGKSKEEAVRKRGGRPRN